MKDKFYNKKLYLIANELGIYYTNDTTKDELVNELVSCLLLTTQPKIIDKYRLNHYSLNAEEELENYLIDKNIDIKLFYKNRELLRKGINELTNTLLKQVEQYHVKTRSIKESFLETLGFI